MMRKIGIVLAAISIILIGGLQLPANAQQRADDEISCKTDDFSYRVLKNSRGQLILQGTPDLMPDNRVVFGNGKIERTQNRTDRIFIKNGFKYNIRTIYKSNGTQITYVMTERGGEPLENKVCNSSSSNSSNNVSLPQEGSFLGQGEAKQSVFGRGKQARASLNYNQPNFSLTLATPSGTEEQVTYMGTITNLKGTNPDNPGSFMLEGRVKSFASSANNLQVINTSGTCEIKVFDARIVSTSCNTNARRSSTTFEGMAQF